MRRLPGMALLLGVAGLITFIATGLGAVASGDLVDAARYTTALLAYAAAIFAFLGGVHWGLVLAPPPAEPQGLRPDTAYRLCLGVAPALVGWAALLIGLFGFLEVALALLIAGLVLFVLAEGQLTRRGLVPIGYMWMRYVLTTIVVLTLGTVVVLRLVGTRLSI